MTNRRARSDDDKLARREAIVHAAADTFDASEFDTFTMDQVAVKLGLAKGTLYRYFPTREALLLAVLRQDLDGWFATVDETLAGAGTSHATASDEVVDAIIEPLLARPRIMRLLAVLPSILEHNVPYESALVFKQFLLERCGTTGALVDTALGAVDGAGVRLLLQLNAGVIGLYHGAHPSPAVGAVLALREFAALRVDLPTELTHLAAALVAAVPRTTSSRNRDHT
jgi:AcrR family transcriptional regulator